MSDNMKLINLNQTIFIPITDETQGGITYEKQMTLEQFFAEILPDFVPEIVDAIPLKWLEWRIDNARQEGFKEAEQMLKTVRDWWNEQKDLWCEETEQDAKQEIELHDTFCNDCYNFDVMTGYCSYDKHDHHPLEEACTDFILWEDEHD